MKVSDNCADSARRASWHLYHFTERLRTGCDLMNLFFVIDEYSDVGDVETVREQKDIVMDALRNPHKPRTKGEWIGGEIARQ